MSAPLQGIKVLEVAAWTFVPAAVALLAEWGADVLTVRHPAVRVPQRGLIPSDLLPARPVGGPYL